MSKLLDKIHKAREVRVTAGDHVFVCRRPSDLDMYRMGGSVRVDDLQRFLVGWEQVAEADIVPGGDPHPAPFDAAACLAWLEDRGDLLVAVVQGLTEAYATHAKAREGAEKN